MIKQLSHALTYIKIDENISNNTKKLLNLFQKYDPIQLLSIIASNYYNNKSIKFNKTGDTEEYYLEYALSLALSLEYSGNYRDVSEDEIIIYYNLVNEIFSDLKTYFKVEPCINLNDTERQIRYDTLLNFIFVRGDSFHQHHIDLISNIYNMHDDFYKSHYGFTSTDIINTIKQIWDQIIENSNKLIKQDFQINGTIFEIKPSEEININILNILSKSFGSNADFSSFKKAPAWPINNSIIYKYPIIKHQNKYYCFSLAVFIRNLTHILENLIDLTNDTGYKDYFYKKRGEYLEDQSIEYFSKILPGAKIYKNLKYKLNINGILTETETDGIIIFDEYLFIIEAKSGSFKKVARRGSIDNIKYCIENILDSAYYQGQRTKEYILNTPNPSFYDKSQLVTFGITYKKIFIINVTLEKFHSLSTHIQTLKNINYIHGKDFFWSVFINDLRVISELSESPSLFLLYLQRRMEIYEKPKIWATDELDLYLFYLDSFLEINSKLLKTYIKWGDQCLISGYTIELNKHYIDNNYKKPHMNIPKDYLGLIQKLESTNKLGFTHISTTLLGIDTNIKDKIFANIFGAIGKCTIETPQEYSYKSTNNNYTLSFYISYNINENEVLEHYKLKKYEYRVKELLLIFIQIENKKIKNINFIILNEDWAFDSEMESKLQDFTKMKGKSLQGVKIGRNEKCPCGSGLKYKKCCAK